MPKPEPPRKPRTQPKPPDDSGPAAQENNSFAPPITEFARTPIATLIDELLTQRAGGTTPLAPPKPLPAGTVGTLVPVPAQSFQQIFTAVATQGNQGSQIWVQDGSELMVMTGKATATLDDGIVLITIPVSCDQAQGVSIQVAFAVGGGNQPAGMVAATEDRPRGPAVIVDVWGDALMAFAWRVLMTVATRVAGQSGVDEDGAGLVPIAMTATKDGLSVLPIARHTFDRVQL